VEKFLDDDIRRLLYLQNIDICDDKYGEKLQTKRAGSKSLSLPTNRAWIASFDEFNVTFPYRYNFAECFDEVRKLAARNCSLFGLFASYLVICFSHLSNW
jgi:hypothetical protein